MSTPRCQRCIRLILRALPAVLLAASASAEPAPPVGHVLGELVELDFDAGQTRPSGDVVHQLDLVVAWEATNPDGLIVIDGHAERTDQPTADLQRSLRRAQYLRDSLIRGGVDPDHIVIAAYASNASSQADAAARRAVIWASREGLYAVVARLGNADQVYVEGEEIRARDPVARR
jgi:outer membrane protein OmpA-like peptidoglycan-associated protein